MLAQKISRYLALFIFALCLLFAVVNHHVPAFCSSREDGIAADLVVRMELGGTDAHANVPFTISIKNARHCSVYYIDMANAEFMPDPNKPNPSEITTDINGSCIFTFILKDHQEFKVLGLPEGTIYSVKEEKSEESRNVSGRNKNDDIWQSIPGYSDPYEGIVGREDVRISFLSKAKTKFTISGSQIHDVLGLLFITISCIAVISEERKKRAEKQSL